MEKPQKPELQHETMSGQYGEIVIQLTALSEAAWSRYLTEMSQYQRFLGGIVLSESIQT